MGDTQALQLEFPVNHHGITEIVIQQRPIYPRKHIEGKGRSILQSAVSMFLEFSKHGLPEECPPDIVNFTVHDVRRHGRIVPVFFKEMPAQKILIACGGDLGGKYCIAVIHVGLRPVGQEGVHGMTRFMDQGINAVDGIRAIVHENVGGRIVTSRGIGAAPFPAVLIAVHPSPQEPLFHGAGILLSEGKHRGAAEINRFLKGHVKPYVLYQGNVGIVKMKFLHIQEPFPQPEVSEQLRQSPPHGFDQRVIHRIGHVVAEQ